MNYKRLIASLVLPQLAGVVGSLFTFSSVSTWYVGLIKPALNPPSWIFGPVWITLYLLMGISVYLIWQKDSKATTLFWIHLFFNASWSVIFFGLQNPGLALINILVILVFIIALIIKFWKIDKRASYLLVPYLLWVSFATYLNYSIWILN